MDIAPDTNVFEGVTSRRFLTALQEMRGHQTVVLPTVAVELTWRVMVVAERHFARREDPTGERRDSREFQDAVRNVRRAARQWLRNEFGRNDAAWVCPDPHRERANEYEGVTERVPRTLFRDARDGRKQVNDIQIVAEAVVHKVPVVATSNMMATGGLHRINEWLDSEGFSRHTTIHDPDAAVAMVLGHDGASPGMGALRAVLGAVAPSDKDDIEPVRIAKSVKMFLGNLYHGGLQETADEVESLCENLGPREIARMMESIHGDRPLRARRATARYVQSVREGAALSGDGGRAP